MDIQCMQIFARVAALKNLSAAGLELGLTPGTISKRIQTLEHDLSVRLFDRTTRSIRITAEGATFLTHVERILNELDTVRGELADTAATPKGPLSVAAPHSLGQRYIMPAILSFLSRHPEIEVRVDFFDRPVHLHDDGYDVAIHAGALTDSSIVAKRLASDRLIVVASPDYLSRHGAPENPADLSRHPCFALNEIAVSGTFAGVAIADIIGLSKRLRSTSADMLRLAAEDGLGFLITSEMLVAEELRAGRLVTVLTGNKADEADDTFGLFAIYPSARHVLPRLRVFLDFLSIWFREARSEMPRTNRPSVRPGCNGINMPSRSE